MISRDGGKLFELITVSPRIVDVGTPPDTDLSAIGFCSGLEFQYPDVPRCVAARRVVFSPESARRRSEVIVKRCVPILYSFLGLVRIATDLANFPERLRVDIGTLTFPVAFTIYFYRSARVKSVFLRLSSEHTVAAV